MRKGDLEEGELYAADGPGESYDCAKLVKVRVLEVGVVADTRRRGGTKADGSRVRLEEDIEWTWIGRPQTESAGREYTMRNARITHPWTEEDDARVERGVTARREDEELRDTLLRLGLSQAVDWSDRTPEQRAELKAKAKEAGVESWETADMEDQPGFELSRRHVTIDRELFMHWIGRIDPGQIAAQAIGEYVLREGRRLGGVMLFAASRDSAVAAVEQGITVADEEPKP